MTLVQVAYRYAICRMDCFSLEADRGGKNDSGEKALRGGDG